MCCGVFGIVIAPFQAMETKLHILLLDGDINLSTVLADYLISAGFSVDTMPDAKTAVEKILTGYYDLVLTELDLRETNGYQLLQQLSKSHSTTPVIVLTSRSGREDIMRAFDLGCDDFVSKPFSMDILICRMRAVIRRCKAQTEDAQTSFTLSGKVFDSVRQTFDGQHLSGKENDLLLLLCRNMNQVVDRHTILRTIWKVDDVFSSRSLSVYVNHLRAFLAGTDYKIMGLHGKGYKLYC